MLTVDNSSPFLRLGASPSQADELRDYSRSLFVLPHTGVAHYPLADEPHIQAWQQYLTDSQRVGVFEALRRSIVQLNFPIAAGISQTPTYVAATRRGQRTWLASHPGLQLERPDQLQLFLQATAAGNIPVIVAGCRADFETLVRAILRKNEPAPVLPSVGAFMVAGYHNWDRWRTAQALDRDRSTNRCQDKTQFQDRFIILSRGAYSGVPAQDMGLDPAEWQGVSLQIRLHHECAHYFTRRVFGSMRNNLLDEVIADYAGIVGAAGAYRADWFLRFLGLEREAEFRSGGRLEQYRGSPPLSDGAFRLLQVLVRRIALGIERLDRVFPPARTPGMLAAMITSLAGSSLEELATDASITRLHLLLSSQLTP